MPRTHAGVSNRPPEEPDPLQFRPGTTTGGLHPGDAVTNDPNYRVGHVERNSFKILPTRVVMDLAGLDADDKAIARTARRMARDYDVSPQVLFGNENPREVLSNITGQPVTFKEARRFTNRFAPVAIATMLANIMEEDAPSTTHPSVAQVPNVKRIGQFANALAQRLDVDLATGMAMAYQISKNERFSAKRFSANYDISLRWLSTGANAPTADDAVVLAIALSRTGTAETFEDVAKVALGGEALEAREEYEQAAAELARLRVEDPVAAAAEENRLQNTFNLSQGAIPLNPDYWGEVQSLSERVRLSNEAFQRSVLGQALTAANNGLNRAWVATEKALVNIGMVPVAGASIVGAGALDAAGQDGELVDTLKVIQQTYDEANARIDAGQTVGQIVQEGWGYLPTKWGGDPVELPDWVGIGFDFAAGWYADPTVIGGKLLAANRARRLLVSNKPTVIRNALAKLPGAAKISRSLDLANLQELRNITIMKMIDSLPSSTWSRRLFDKLDDTTEFWHRIDIEGRGVITQRTVDPVYMQRLRNAILERYPDLKAPEAWQAWQEGVRAHYVGYGPPGSAAELAVRERIGMAGAATKEAADKVATGLPEMYGLDPTDLLPSRGLDNEMHFWVAELPNASALGRLGPRRLLRQAYTSRIATTNPLLRKIGAMANINPGRVMPLFGDGAVDYLTRHARRWTAFSEADVQKFAARARGIIASGQRTETRLMELVDDINDKALENILGKYNVDEAFAKQIHDDLFDPIHKFNEDSRKFGIDASGQPLGSPILESQLQNTGFVIDPVTVRSMVRDYIGVHRRAHTMFAKALKSEAPEIAAELGAWNNRAARSFKHFSGDVYDAWNRAWKGLTVARPGYIPRVILLDENARFMSATDSFFERMIAQEWWGATRKLDDAGVFTRRFLDDKGDEIAKIGLPGAYERNALATNDIRQAEILDEVLKASDVKVKGIRGESVTWDLLEPARAPKAHLEAWTWHLNKQFPNSAPGRVALEGVVEGDGVEALAQRLMDWAQTDNHRILRGRMGIDIEDTQDWANDLASMTHLYTGSDPSIAKAALSAEARDLRRVLDGVPLANRPKIHGPTVEVALNGVKSSWWDKLVQTNYNLWVRNPESRINRQPFFKTMKRRAEEGYTELAAGQLAKLPEVKLLAGSKRVVTPDLDLSELAARSTPGDASGYVYHITSPDNLSAIRASGLEPRQSFYGLAAELVPPELRKGRVFFADSIDRALDLGRKGGDDYIAFRIKAADVGETIPERSFSGSQFGFKGVPPSRIEVLGADDVWRPLSTGFDDDLRRAIDKASDDFAFEQVNKVMFDLTKQSRFTELIRFAFPFPQPFFEGFQAWAHLVRRNPKVVGRAQALFRLGKATGMIEEDPITGEVVIPLKPVEELAQVFAAAAGMDYKRFDSLGIRFVAPLSSFNMLSSTTVKFGGQGLLGALIGGVPLPVPGLRPEVMLAFQKIFAKTQNEALISYLFQYGPSARVMPTSVLNVLNALSPEMLDENGEYIDRLAQTLLRAYQANGVGFDANGVPTMTEQEIIDKARRDATKLAQAQALTRLISPAAPRIQTDATALEAEWQSVIEAHPDDYTAALDEWGERHPDQWLITVGKTMWEAGVITDPQSGESVTGPRLNASRLVANLLNEPGIGDVMRRDKAWAGLVLLGLDPELVEEQDFGVFGQFLANGDVRYSTPEEFFAKGEATPVWREIEEFYTTTWNPGMEAIERAGLDDQDAAYTALVAERKKMFAGIATRYPMWAAHNLDDETTPDGGVSWDWPTGTADPPTTIVLAHARQLAAEPGFEEFPGIQALQDYLVLRDDIEQRMFEEGYSSITQDNAAGLAKEYAKGVEAITEAVPGFDQYLSALLGVRIEDGVLVRSDDLQDLVSPRYARWNDIDPDLLPAVVEFDTTIEKMGTRAFRTKEPDDYLALQRYVDGQFHSLGRRGVDAWWEAKTPNEQREYRDNLVTKWPGFYSALDWHVMGVELDAEASDAWQKIAERRTEIQAESRDAKLNQTDYDSGAAYDALDRSIALFAKANPSFKESLDKANQWSFAMTEAHLDELPGKVGKAWASVIEATDSLQNSVNGGGLFGPSGFGNTEAQNAWYIHNQNELNRFVEEWFGYAPAFKRSWFDFQSQLDGKIIGSIILPDEYYGPLGAPNYGG